MDEVFHDSKSSIEEDDDSHDHQLPLRTAPSFEIYNNSSQGFGDDDADTEELLKRTITIGQRIEATGSGEFSFRKKGMDSIEEEAETEKDGLTIGNQKLGVDEEVELEPPSPPMYLAAGLGVHGTGFEFDKCTRDDLCMPNLDGSDAEENYKKIVDDYPCHPIILRNYAHMLQVSLLLFLFLFLFIFLLLLHQYNFGEEMQSKSADFRKFTYVLQAV